MRVMFLGFSGHTVSPFSEAWWKCEFWIILWSSVEASGCNAQKAYKPNGKCFIVTMPDPYSPSNAGENSRTTVGTSWTSALLPGLGS
jgi:hypothetical protein